MKVLYENLIKKAGGDIEVLPFLLEDNELTVSNIQNLMAFTDTSKGTPLYLEVIHGILRKYGRNNQAFSVEQFLTDLDDADLLGKQAAPLEQRITLLKNFSAAAVPGIVKDNFPHLHGHRLRRQQAVQGLGFKGDCIRVGNGTLTIINLSDPFVDTNTACTLFEICHGIILKRHKEAYDAKRISPGLILCPDEPHKFLDKDLPAAESFTASLLMTIREQRRNAARAVIATQEPSISEKFLDLCSVSIVHRFSSPAWFTTIAGHLGGAASITSNESDDGQKFQTKKAHLFNRILDLKVGESLVFSPTSWVRGGEGVVGDGGIVEPRKLGKEVLWMRTWERKGEDSGRTVSVV